MSKSMVLKNLVKWTVTFSMVIAMQSFIFAEGDNDKVGSVAFKFLNIQTDARGAALGGLSAQASGAGALFSNPAGIAGTEGMNLTAGLSQYLLETSITNFGFVSFSFALFCFEIQTPRYRGIIQCWVKGGVNPSLDLRFIKDYRDLGTTGTTGTQG